MLKTSPLTDIEKKTIQEVSFLVLFFVTLGSSSLSLALFYSTFRPFCNRLWSATRVWCYFRCIPLRSPLILNHNCLVVAGLGLLQVQLGQDLAELCTTQRPYHFTTAVQDCDRYTEIV